MFLSDNNIEGRHIGSESKWKWHLVGAIEQLWWERAIKWILLLKEPDLFVEKESVSSAFAG